MSGNRRAPRKVFVANRGEVALRVIRAARELGLSTATAARGADRELPFAEAAGSLLELPEGEGEPYLDAALLVELARRAGADLLHPGYGFLSESAELAEECRRAGIVFIGPPPEALLVTGNKVEAREAARRAGVPVIPGRSLPTGTAAGEAEEAGREVGFPLLVKAAAGGGGRGIRRVEEPGKLAAEVEAASREAREAFGDGRVYLERALEAPRHVEVQALVDAGGRTALFPERECSLQRRHQKVVEESPSPAVDSSLREKLVRAAESALRAVGYRNAGTVEFLLDGEGRFYFLEINARLQVEHPVTELVSGVDLVAWQIRLAAGEPLPESLLTAFERPAGHAIECRLTAERPPRFLPSTGRLLVFRPPAGPGVRADSGYREGNLVEARYDSLLAKLIAWGPERHSALERMRGALEDTVVLGVETNLDVLRWVVDHPRFRAGEVDVGFLAREMSGWEPPPPSPEALAIAAEVRRRGAAAPAPGAPAAAAIHGGGRPYPGPWDPRPDPREGLREAGGFSGAAVEDESRSSRGRRARERNS